MMKPGCRLDANFHIPYEDDEEGLLYRRREPTIAGIPAHSKVRIRKIFAREESCYGAIMHMLCHSEGP